MRRLAWAGLIVAMAGGACGADPAGGNRPVLRIATDATFAPFHFRDEAGRATGFDVELARQAAERAGFTAEIIVRPYDDLLAGLTTGTHDMVAATTGVTPEREAVHLFTQPYFETCQAALVRVGEGEPTTVAQLAGRRVGASGTGTAFKAMRSVEHATHVTLGKGQAGIPALGERSIDALIFDEFDAVDAARKSGGVLQVLREPIALERYAFVLPKDRIDWKRALDRALDELEQVGTVEELRARFGIARGEAWPIDLGAVR